MAIFNYRAIDAEGHERQGTIDAVSIDVAITSLQRRGLVISAIKPEDKPQMGLQINFFQRVTNEDVVILSRQITTLFEAQVSALRAFQLLASEARTPLLGDKLTAVAADIQNGSSISVALSHQPDVFTPFYVNMVRAGEETGKLDETFAFLADYLDRNYEITKKAKNALIYPVFVLFTFATVMVLMMTMVIPKIAGMLTEQGQAIPIYTRVVIAMSMFMSHYILLFVLIVAGACFLVYQYTTTPHGREVLSVFRLGIPVVGTIFQKLYLSRISDNLATMLKSGVQIMRGIEITIEVVGDPVYERVLRETAVDVKSGMPLSEALRRHPEIPGIVRVMVKIGEETGNMGTVLDTMARFYRREVNNSVDTLVGLIEPLMIVVLALGVGFLLAAVLVPIYNLAGSF